MMMPTDHPFYRMKDFKLRYHDSLEFHESLLLSSNFFNPNWSGLRRVKNVVMVCYCYYYLLFVVLLLLVFGKLNLFLLNSDAYVVWCCYFFFNYDDGDM